MITDARLQQVAEAEVIYLPYYFLLAFECHRTSGSLQDRLEDLKNLIAGTC